MKWWLEEDNVRLYTDMVKDSPGISYLDCLLDSLPSGAHVLELGMGPGKDLDILSAHYRMAGSDLSPIFVESYRKRHADAELYVLDAVALDFGDNCPDLPFDGIVSNKVLVHLTAEELRLSLERQVKLIRPGGILCHSFWTGSREESFDGLYFHYWEKASLEALMPSGVEIVQMWTYEEEESGDSLLLMFRRINQS